MFRSWFFLVGVNKSLFSILYLLLVKQTNFLNLCLDLTPQHWIVAWCICQAYHWLAEAVDIIYKFFSLFGGAYQFTCICSSIKSLFPSFVLLHTVIVPGEWHLIQGTNEKLITLMCWSVKWSIEHYLVLHYLTICQHQTLFMYQGLSIAVQSTIWELMCYWLILVQDSHVL